MKQKILEVWSYLKKLNPVLVGFLVLIVFFLIPSEHSAYRQISYYMQRKELTQERDKLQRSLQESKKKIQDLSFDPAELERYAREHYLMKEEDEDLYVIDRREVDAVTLKPHIKK